MNKKYELTSDTKLLPDGRVLYRIRSLVNTAHASAGELGGFIESESNLSTDDISWIANEAMVYGHALIRDDALVSDHAIVCDNSVIWCCAKISGHAVISDFAHIGGFSDISGHSSLNFFTSADSTKMYDYNRVIETSPKDKLYSRDFIRMECREDGENKHSFLKDLAWHSLEGIITGAALGLLLILLN